ncbi:MAG: hypothetical protein K2O42_09675 [Oscillospiraceae bacterium]|nr:hypothetical protein [Oscillospiraceae bacterium]
MKTRLEILNPDKSDTKRKMTREEFILCGLELLKNTQGCGFILEQDIGLLLNRYDVDARSGLTGINELDLFLKYGTLQENENLFLVIHNIDFIEEQEQSIFFSLAKDRCIHEYNDLLDDVIIVFTLSNINGSKKILYNLWNFGNDFINV